MTEEDLDAFEHKLIKAAAAHGLPVNAMDDFADTLSGMVTLALECLELGLAVEPDQLAKELKASKE